MAHNLYKNTMAYTGEMPWHQLGVQIPDDTMTAEQAIQAAAMGYFVEKQQLFLGNGNPTDCFATVNMDTQDVLGFVTDRYEVLQNTEAFEFFDTLLMESGARYITAGAIGKGERIWLLAKMPKEFMPLLGDRVDSFCLLTNSHDGSSGVEVRFTPIRVVCQNTLNAAIQGTKSSVSVRHTRTVKDRLVVAAEILRSYNKYFERMGDVYKSFAQLKVDDEMIEAYIKDLYGDLDEIPEGRGRTIAANHIELYRTRLATGMGVDLPGVKNTLWWLYNAAVETTDYDRKFRAGTDRAEGILWGSGADFKQKAMNSALVLVK